MPAQKRLADYFIFYVSLLLFFAVGAITTLGLEWYGILLLPVWAPSTFLAALIWCLLFVLTALSAVQVWNHEPRDASFAVTIGLYMGNGLLVLFWNYLFFGKHALFLSLMLSLLVLISVLVLIVRVRPLLKSAALLLVPYFLWMLFAATLMYQVLRLNT
jgi:tryptophan-rich sensory protein